jgi:hypothetical protein
MIYTYEMSGVIGRSVLIKLYLAIVAVFLLSFLRPALFIFLPLFVAFYFCLFNAKISKHVLLLLCITILSSILVGAYYVGEFNAGNIILSTYIMIPVLVMFFSKSTINPSSSNENYLHSFMRLIAGILIVSNLIGFFQLALYGGDTDDDAFIGLYGTHGLGTHTLSIVNFIMSIFYFFKFRHEKRQSSKFLALFFLLSGIVSFYGLGLLVFMAAIIIYNLSLKSLMKSMVISGFLVLFLGVGLYFIKPTTFDYNYANMKIVISYLRGDVPEENIQRIPRKFILYKNYLSLYPTDPTLFLFGSGPGTFNSRTSFLLNGDYAKTDFLENIFGVYQPHYAVKGAFSLWNSKISLASTYMNGSRNQPFSSIISVPAEYGFIFFIVVLILIYRRYHFLFKSFKRLLRSNPENLSREKLIGLFKFLKFSSLFIFLSLFTDNYLEYPEIILFYLLLLKLVELEFSRFANGANK